MYTRVWLRVRGAWYLSKEISKACVVYAVNRNVNVIFALNARVWQYVAKNRFEFF